MQNQLSSSSASSSFALPPVHLPGSREILERFCSETGDYFVVAPTSEDEIRQLRQLEARREELCIELLEANRVADARVVERRLDLVRERMKDVEVLCRYAQSVYSSVRAAHEPGFRPVPKAGAAAGAGTTEEEKATRQQQPLTAEEEEEQRTEQKEKETMARLFPALKTDTTGFRLDESDFCDTGYCIVFSCSRDHPPSRLQQLQELMEVQNDQLKKSITNSNGGSSSLFRQRLQLATSANASSESPVPSSAFEEEQQQDEGSSSSDRLWGQQQHPLGRAPTMCDFLTFEMDKIISTEKTEQLRQQQHERMYGNEASRRKQQQQVQDAAQHQLSFSCDGRVDSGRCTAESKLLSEKLRVAIETSLEKLPLARWGDENRSRGIETALMGSLDSLFGVIVAKNKDDAEDFYQILRKSETLLDEEIDEQQQQQQQQNASKQRRFSVDSDATSSSSNVDDETMAAATPPPKNSSAVAGTPLRFVQKKKRRNPVGHFVKTLSRVIPAGGSRACSDIVKQMAQERNVNIWNLNNNNKKNDDDDDDHGSNSNNNRKKHDTAWWMKTLGCTTIEAGGLVDALQRVVTECTPFMQQRSHDIVVRGGTTAGALDAPDDASAAALCLVLDGDAGFEYSCADVQGAAAKFKKIIQSYFGEVVQLFGDYAVAVFWALPPQSVLDDYEFDEGTTTQLPKGVALNRLSPATRAVLAAMELHAQVRRASCGVSIAALEKRTSDDILGREDYDLFGLRERAYTYNKMGLNTTGEYVSDRDKEEEMHKHKLKYNCMAHTTPLASVTGAAVDGAVELGLMTERVLRRPVVVAAAAAAECDEGVAKLSRFSHNLVEYFTPVVLETLRLEEPPAEKLIGRFDAGGGNSNNDSAHLAHGMGVEHDDTAVDLSRSVATGFTVAKKSNRKRINFHSIHSEPTLRRLFVNLEPYRGCGYLLRQQLKEALYPLCFVDPLRVQAGAALESELAARAREKYEEFEASKYQSALAREGGAASGGEELSPMEVMRLMLLQARKEQRKKDREKLEGAGAADSTVSLSQQLKEQQDMQQQAKEGKKRRKDDDSQQQQQSGKVKTSLFDIEGTIGNKKDQNKSKDKFEVQSDIHKDVLKMYKDVFGDDMIGVTHDVLDTMLRPLRNNKASEHVTFPEFLLFAARLQQE